MNKVFKSSRDCSQFVEFGKLSSKLVKLKAAILAGVLLYFISRNENSYKMQFDKNPELLSLIILN